MCTHTDPNKVLFEGNASHVFWGDPNKVFFQLDRETLVTFFGEIRTCPDSSCWKMAEKDAQDVLPSHAPARVSPTVA